MNTRDLDILSRWDDRRGIYKVLTKFMKEHENTYTFPQLTKAKTRERLWFYLFQHLQNRQIPEFQLLILNTIKILSRDKTDMDDLLTEHCLVTLTDKAGLYCFVELEDDPSIFVEMQEKDIVVEALKCLCNIMYHSEYAREFCAKSCVPEGLMGRLKTQYKEIAFKEDIMLYDIKLLFILTALRRDIKMKIKNEYHGMDYLTSCLKELITEASSSSEQEAAACHAGSGDHCLLNDMQQAISCELLKTLFNLVLRPESEEPLDEAEEAVHLKLVPVLASLLYAHASSEEKLMELRSNIANLLTCVPPMYYSGLTPELKDGDTAENIYDNRNMDALQALLHLLQYRLTITKNAAQQYENLSPILTVMNKSSRGCREQRKYLRNAVLPPLRDVTMPPEQGTTLRNQLCRLLTTPMTPVRDLVAEFLFILCKEKVGRLVKYTGFGNAAGHLAQKGLLGGAISGNYSSSSDESDTEEYLEAQPNIDPVVGCTRPPRSNPFEGMTEEQKEHEAMKLVQLFDQMLMGGVVRPARVGEDGRPEPIEHVLELRDKLPNRPQS